VAIARGVGGISLATAASAITTPVDISTATNGEWIYVFFGVYNSIGAASLTCTTNGSGTVNTLQAQTTQGSGATVGSVGAWYIKKQSSDTTLTISWTTSRPYVWAWQQWTGLHPTTPHEGYSGAAITAAANVFTSPSSTPTDTTRWGVFFIEGVDGNVNTNAVSWTPTAPQVEIGHVRNNTFSHPVNGLFDSNGTLASAASQSYTATYVPSGSAMTNGYAGILFLIPASTTVFQPTITKQAVNRAAVI
jgi:hypothetical protein